MSTEILLLLALAAFIGFVVKFIVLPYVIVAYGRDWQIAAMKKIEKAWKNGYTGNFYLYGPPHEVGFFLEKLGEKYNGLRMSKRNKGKITVHICPNQRCYRQHKKGGPR